MVEFVRARPWDCTCLTRVETDFVFRDHALLTLALVRIQSYRIRVMTRPITIRPVTAEDAAVVATLLTTLGYSTPVSAVPARLEQVWTEGGVAWLAVDAAGTGQGFLSMAAHTVLHAAGPVALITGLVVRPETRGQGIGRQLVETAKTWAAAHGCVRLLVTSAEHRADAHAFYPACGLAYTGRRFSAALEPAT
jgi:GNAT superfamily N-acetyltransferase